MTPQREEAASMLRLARREFRFDDEAPQLLTVAQAQAVVASLLAWADAQTALGAAEKAAKSTLAQLAVSDAKAPDYLKSSCRRTG